jgi:F-type H+-transporting ATPase subunit a
VNQLLTLFMVAQTEHAVVTDTVAHVASGTAEQGAPEFPNILEILHQTYHGQNALINLLFQFRIVFFSALVWLILGLLAYMAFRKRSLIPTPIQNFMEWVVESLANMITGVLGERGKQFIPFIGTLFVYIFGMNLFGLIPGMFSPTSKLNTTLALAICVFLYVQYTGLRNFGILGYMHHLAGSPKSGIEWALVPLNLPLHIIGELARPVSLSLRLFGNITGEDMLLAIFATLGVSVLSFTHMPIGIPLQVPFIFLAILTSFVQALVFTLLTTIYFSLMSTHDEEHH